MARKEQYGLPETKKPLVEVDIEALEIATHNIHEMLCQARDYIEISMKRVTNINQWITEQKLIALKKAGSDIT